MVEGSPWDAGDGAPSWRVTAGKPLRQAASGGRDVATPPRDDMAHPANGVRDVAGVTRDQVDVDVGNRLPGRRADVDPEVIASGVQDTVQVLFHLAEQLVDGRHLHRREVEVRKDMPPRQDERVPR